jgi:hypothetical protein
MTPDDIAQIRHHIKTHSETCATSCALIERLLEDYEHAVCTEGDHLSIASRRMVDTVMGERDALRAEVRRMQAAMHHEVVLAEDRGQESLAERLRAAAKIQIRGWK